MVDYKNQIFCLNYKNRRSFFQFKDDEMSSFDTTSHREFVFNPETGIIADRYLHGIAFYRIINSGFEGVDTITTPTFKIHTLNWHDNDWIILNKDHQQSIYYNIKTKVIYEKTSDLNLSEKYNALLYNLFEKNIDAFKSNKQTGVLLPLIKQQLVELTPLPKEIVINLLHPYHNIYTPIY